MYDAPFLLAMCSSQDDCSLQFGAQPTAKTNGTVPHAPASPADSLQPLQWMPASGPPMGLIGAFPDPATIGTMLPMDPAQGGQPGSYEGQLVSHIMQYINNLWRIDPSNFAATLNMICMRAPALMQRMMDHELAANAAVDQRFAQQQQGQGGFGTLAAMSSLPALPASANPLQHPHELEVRISFAMC